jgi:hypothetical protein
MKGYKYQNVHMFPKQNHVLCSVFMYHIILVSVMVSMETNLKTLYSIPMLNMDYKDF